MKIDFLCSILVIMSAYTVTAKYTDGLPLPTLEIVNEIGDRWIASITLIDAPDNKACHYLQACPESVACAVDAKQWAVEEKDNRHVLVVSLDHIKRNLELAMRPVPENEMSRQARLIACRVAAVECDVKEIRRNIISYAGWMNREEFVSILHTDGVKKFAVDTDKDYKAFRAATHNTPDDVMFREYYTGDKPAFELVMYYRARIENMCIARVRVDRDLKITHVLLVNDTSPYTVAVHALPYSGKDRAILQTHFVEPEVEILRQAMIGILRIARDWALFKVSE